MVRQARSNLPDGLFHVTTRGVYGLDLYRDDHDRHAFLWLLDYVVANFELTSLSSCLMVTPSHLILGGRREDLTVGMRRLNGRYARLQRAPRDRRAGLRQPVRGARHPR